MVKSIIPTKMPACSTDCIFFRPAVGNFPPRPILFRESRRLCSTPNCETRISEYTHNFCFRCAPPNSIEFNYHHSRCVLPAGTAPSAQFTSPAPQPAD